MAELDDELLAERRLRYLRSRISRVELLRDSTGTYTYTCLIDSMAFRAPTARAAIAAAYGHLAAREYLTTPRTGYG